MATILATHRPTIYKAICAGSIVCIPTNSTLMYIPGIEPPASPKPPCLGICMFYIESGHGQTQIWSQGCLWFPVRFYKLLCRGVLIININFTVKDLFLSNTTFYFAQHVTFILSVGTQYNETPDNHKDGEKSNTISSMYMTPTVLTPSCYPVHTPDVHVTHTMLTNCE